MAQVGFDGSFFTKALNDYSNWKQAFIREGMQNHIDCGSNTIRYKGDIHPDGLVRIAFENDGEVMTKQIMEEKLMNIGGTTKTGGPGHTVGGFGVAKIVLYMGHHGYHIHSGNHVIRGNGGYYDIEQVDDYYDGTKSVVLFQSDNPESLLLDIQKELNIFARYAQWKGKLLCNFDGDWTELHTNLQKGHFRRELSFGRLYTNKKFKNRIVFRINGIPMFIKYIDYDNGVLVEATKGSIELMTSNRDGLKYQYQSEIEQFIRTISTNRSEAFRQDPVVEIFGNEMISCIPGSECPDIDHDDHDGDVDNDINGDTAHPQTNMGVDSGPVDDSNDNGDTDGGNVDTDGQEQPVRSILVRMSDDVQAQQVAYTNRSKAKRPKPQIMFMIYNDSGMAVPDYAKPGNMSSYCNKLLSVWTKLLVTMHYINGIEDTFGVGFCLGEAKAKFVSSGGRKFYLINPFDIVKQNNSNSRSFRRCHSFVSKEELIMTAVHEFVHGALRLVYHDEDYASELTDQSIVAMRNISKLKQCFKG